MHALPAECVSSLSDPIMVIVEYCSLGNLQDFLRKQRRMQNYAKSEGEDMLDTKLLVRFAYQISQGMSHLSRRQVGPSANES